MSDAAPGLDTTVAEVKEYLKANIRQGVECPACRQHVKLYRRGLHAQQVVDLIRIYQAWCRIDALLDDFVAIRNVPGVRGGDYAKLAWFGLLEQMPKDPEDKSRRTSGRWRPTVRGRRFVRAEIRIPQAVFIYNGKAHAGPWDDEVGTVDVHEALGTKFHYGRLMAGD